MTRPTLSLIIAVCFIILSLSTPIIPCRNVDNAAKFYQEWDLCVLDGEQLYYSAEQLSDPLIAGIVSAVIVFLISLLILCILFPSKKVW